MNVNAIAVCMSLAASVATLPALAQDPAETATTTSIYTVEASYSVGGNDFVRAKVVIEFAHVPGATFYSAQGWGPQQGQRRWSLTPVHTSVAAEPFFPKAITAQPGNLIYILASGVANANDEDDINEMYAELEANFQIIGYPWKVYARKTDKFRTWVSFDPDTVSVGETFEATLNFDNYLGTGPALMHLAPTGPLTATSEDGGAVTIASGPSPESLDSLSYSSNGSMQYSLVADSAGTVLMEGMLEAEWDYFYPDVIESTSVCGEFESTPCSVVIVDGGLLNPPLDTLLVPGDEFAVLWSTPSSELVDLYYTTDREPSATSDENTLIAEGLDAVEGEYTWTIPDTLSPSVRLLLKDSDNPEINDFSERFRVRPYALVRLLPDSTYEAFTASRHGWTYSNSISGRPAAESFWPETYWRQFDTYLEKIDPFSGLPYAADPSISTEWVFSRTFPVQNDDGEYETTEFGFPGSLHPEWTGLVRAFGEDDTYDDIVLETSVSYNREAVFGWKELRTPEYGGICYGLAASSAMLFTDGVRFGSTFPSIGNHSMLADFRPDLTQETDVVRDLNTLFYRQFDADLSCRSSGVIELLEESFTSDEQTDAWVISISGASGAHTMVPVSLSVTESGSYEIGVYDPNHPSVNDRAILFNPETGQGSYQEWGAVSVFLQGTASELYGEGTLEFRRGVPGDICGTTVSKQTDLLTIFGGRNRSAGTLISGAASDIGWQNDELVGDTDIFAPLFVQSGIPGPPYGYILPTGRHSVERTIGPDSTTSTVFMGQDGTIEYRRSRSVPGAADTAFYRGDGGLTVRGNQSAGGAISVVMSDAAGAAASYLLAVEDLIAPSGDSLRIGIAESDEPVPTAIVQNFGGDASYTLTARIEGSAQLGLFRHYDVEIRAGATHSFRPQTTVEGKVEVDVDSNGDGVVDESIELSNQQVMGTNRVQSEVVPEDSQSLSAYPNPAHSEVTIVVRLSKAQRMRLEIADMLGRTVYTLHDGWMTAGMNEVSVDVRRIPSGVYAVSLFLDGHRDVRLFSVKK